MIPGKPASAGDFVGTWRLVSVEGHAPSGEVTYPYGRDASGFIMYAPDGYMSVVICTGGRKRFGTADVLAGSRDELAHAASSYLSYVGRYEVHSDRVHHLVEASLFPDWVGTIQERRYEFEGRRLTLSTDPTPLGGKQLSSVLTWERVTRAR